MVGQRISDEEKIIRKMGMVVNDEIDVKAAVMKRVRTIHGGQNFISRDGEMTSIMNERMPFPEPGDPVMEKQEKILPRSSRYRKRLLSGVSAAVLLGIIGFGVLLVSGPEGLMEHGSSRINITKASNGAALFDSVGKVIVQTVHRNSPAPTTSSAIEKYLSILESYKEQVLARLNAGEMAAYYVNDPEFIKLVKGLGYKNLQFAMHSPVYSGYQEFVKELKNAGDFWPELPSTLIGNYEFEQGTFNAAPPDKGIDKEYKDLLELFQSKAKADTTGQKLFMQKIAINAVENAEVTYRKGEQRITLSLLQIAPKGNNAMKMSVLEGQAAEKWSVTSSGKEAIFIAASTQKGAQTWASRNLLYWYDEARQMVYSLNDQPSNKLTREQWQMIAASFIR